MTISEIEKFCEDSLITEYGKNLESLVISLWSVFLKENQLGQSVYTQYVEETKCPIDQYLSDPKDLPEFALDLISNKNSDLQTLILDHFELEGESVYERVQFPIVFLALKKVMKVWEDKGDDDKHCLLWSARLAFIHNDLLSSSVE